MNPIPDPIESPAAAAPAAQAPEEPSAVANLVINVILPVMVLEWVSKEGSKPWNLGPAWALGIAVVLPLAYALWFFVRTRKTNVISLVGVASVLLTGGIAWAAWRADGSVDPSLFKFYAIKEALLPGVIGLCVLLSHRTKTPLVRLMIFNDQFFNIPLIDKGIDTLGNRRQFEAVLWKATLFLTGSFLLSGLLSYLLALYFLSGLDAGATNARELYNKAVSKQTLWGFVAIGLPFVLVLWAVLQWLLKRLQTLSGLSREQLTSDD